ncbi:hypothetical protein TWF481_010910 [Arthrobotrys musiformis]|uniref:Uncharacterized protein n=1 Tax=Arthrobotrys musiformis TaxID=47236 RepID=A0AAV9VWV2_9PEZI
MADRLRVDEESQAPASESTALVNNQHCPLQHNARCIESYKWESTEIIGPQDSITKMQFEEIQIQGQLASVTSLNAAGTASFKVQRQPGTTLKDTIYKSFQDGYLGYLYSPVGIVLSLCTGVGATITLAETCRRSLSTGGSMVGASPFRNKVRERSDLLDRVLTCPPETRSELLNGLSDTEKSDLTFIISSIIRQLLQTGVSRDEKSFLAFDPTSNQNALVGIPFRMVDSPFLSIFRDTKDTAAFVILTLECLEVGQLRCQNSKLELNSLPTSTQVGPSDMSLHNARTNSASDATASEVHLSPQCNGVLACFVRVRDGEKPLARLPPLRLEADKRYEVRSISNGFLQASSCGSELRWHCRSFITTMFRSIASYLGLFVDRPVLLVPQTLQNSEAVQAFVR